MTENRPSAYQEAFEAAFQRLNEAQRRAVSQVEGPVLLIAGPGTGKTHVLATRVGKILTDTDARPQNILCLTFTDAGAQAMRKRLLTLIGPDAHKVPIYTFHAFCNSIIQENAEVFGRSDWEPAGELEQVECIRELLEKLPDDHFLLKGQKHVYFYERHLRDLFQIMKKEGWTPGFVRRKVAEMIDSIDNKPEFRYQKNTRYGKKGELKTTKVADTVQRTTLLAEAADLYPKYLHAMERAGRYDYEDMILWVLKAFGNHENLLRNYQERYLYFLVDEYQDTNGAQNKLLGHLLDYWPNPNVFIVGDDDQSIFEFQGARLQNLLEFYYAHRQNLLALALEQNYRSSQAILDAAGRLIAHNELRAVHALANTGLEKNLRAVQSDGDQPVIAVYENRLHEMCDIAAQISACIAAGENPEQIAVLYAKHRQADKLIALLAHKGIPYQTKKPVNILDLPEIIQLRALLSFVADALRHPGQVQDNRLFRLLHAPWWGIRSVDLACLAAEHPEKNLRRALSATSDESLRRVGLLLESFVSDAAAMPLPGFLQRIFTRSGMLQWALAQPDKNRQLPVWSGFLAFAENEATRDARFSLERLLSMLANMDDNKIPLFWQQTIKTGPGVQFLSAHASKGLEFERVFIIDTVADQWEPGVRSNRNRFMLPDTLTLSGEEDAMEARRRLFYVAMTRAKKHLHISYSISDFNGKAMNKARFLDEIGLEPVYPQPVAAELQEAQVLLVLEPAAPVVTLPDEAILDNLLEDFRLSITALNRYLNCPLSFYYQDVLNIPETMSEAAAYGYAVHETLRRYFPLHKSDKHHGRPGDQALLSLFQEEMERQRVYFSENEFRRRLLFGQESLRRYWAEQMPHWRRRAVTEYRIERTVLDGVPLTGVIDKIEWLDQGLLRLVDYKTGEPDNAKLAPPSDKMPHGGPYWRQLAFYQLLLEAAARFPERVAGGMIAWLEADKRGRVPVSEMQFGVADLQLIRQLITQTWADIQARKFNTGCGAPDCVWCSMHRYGQTPDDWVNAEEDLDDKG